MGKLELVYHLANIGAQALAFSSASLGVPMPTTGVSIMSYQGDNARARAIVTQYVGPVGMLGVAMISLIALLFGEGNSKLVFSILVYFHYVIAASLVNCMITKQPHFLVTDAVEGATYHVLMGTLAVIFVIRQSFSKPSAKKSKSL